MRHLPLTVWIKACNLQKWLQCWGLCTGSSVYLWAVAVRNYYILLQDSAILKISLWMWPTVVLQRKEVINQVGYSNQFSLFCFHYKIARQTTKGRGAADMPSETPSNIYSTCHGNQVFVAVPTPGVCPCFTGLLCHQFWIAMFQGPASRWRHPPFPTWPPASEYLWAFPNELPLFFTINTCRENMYVF